MQFRVDNRVYDDTQLAPLGSGSFGVVYDLGHDSRAAKIFHDPPTAEGVRKLTRLIDIRRSLERTPDIAENVALPRAAATLTTDGTLVGFSMKAFLGWIRLSKLGYQRTSGSYQQEAGFRFTDESAVASVYSMFRTLNALSSFHMTIGDISQANVFVNPTSCAAGFIDVDDSGVDEWNVEECDSTSQGTEGYVDPRVLEGNQNAAGGYQFDAQSDIFALTVVAYRLTMGIMPFFMAVHPPTWKDEDFLRHRASNLKVLFEGDGCLSAHGKTLVDGTLPQFLHGRVEALRKVRGVSGADGHRLIEHFRQVFLANERSNLVDGLPDGDSRSPMYRSLVVMGTPWVIGDLEGKYGRGLSLSPTQRRPQAPEVDPRPFNDFLSARGIDLSMMVSPA